MGYLTAFKILKSGAIDDFQIDPNVNITNIITWDNVSPYYFENNSPMSELVEILRKIAKEKGETSFMRCKSKLFWDTKINCYMRLQKSDIVKMQDMLDYYINLYINKYIPIQHHIDQFKKILQENKYDIYIHYSTESQISDEESDKIMEERQQRIIERKLIKNEKKQSISDNKFKHNKNRNNHRKGKNVYMTT